MTFTVTIDDDLIQLKLNEYAKKAVSEILNEWDFKAELTRQVKSKMKAQAVQIIEEEFADIEALRSGIKERISKSLTAQITKKINEEVNQ